jgi:hypothetical protein
LGLCHLLVEVLLLFGQLFLVLIQFSCHLLNLVHQEVLGPLLEILMLFPEKIEFDIFLDLLLKIVNLFLSLFFEFLLLYNIHANDQKFVN